MKYYQTIQLKDGRTCVLRNAVEADAQAALDCFRLAHAQTDYLLSYPDENTMTVEDEAQFLKKKAESVDEIELAAVLDGKIVGLAGVSRVGTRDKVKHRAEFGISVDKSFWGRGIGRALTNACIECAKKAGYAQLELGVVAENAAAITLYQSVGFTEYGRNPRGFCSRFSGWQALVLMRLELK